MAIDRYGGEVTVNAPYPQDPAAASVGSGTVAPDGGGGGIPMLGKLLGMLGGPLGQVAGMASSLMGCGCGAPELPKLTWDMMQPTSPSEQIIGNPMGGPEPGGPTSVPTEDPMLFAGAPAGMIDKKSKVQKQTETGSKKGENPDENKMGGWDKAAIAAQVASGLLNQGGPPLPNVGFTPGRPVSSDFMV